MNLFEPGLHGVAARNFEAAMERLGEVVTVSHQSHVTNFVFITINTTFLPPRLLTIMTLSMLLFHAFTGNGPHNATISTDKPTALPLCRHIAMKHDIAALSLATQRVPPHHQLSPLVGR